MNLNAADTRKFSDSGWSSKGKVGQFDVGWKIFMDFWSALESLGSVQAMNFLCGSEVKGDDIKLYRMNWQQIVYKQQCEADRASEQAANRNEAYKLLSEMNLEAFKINNKLSWDALYYGKMSSLPSTLTFCIHVFNLNKMKRCDSFDSSVSFLNSDGEVRGKMDCSSNLEICNSCSMTPERELLLDEEDLLCKGIHFSDQMKGKWKRFSARNSRIAR